LEDDAVRPLADVQQMGRETPLAFLGALQYNLGRQKVPGTFTEDFKARASSNVFGAEPDSSSEVPGTFVSWEGEMSNWLERYRGYVLITLINLVVLGAVIVFFRRPQQPELIVTSPSPTATSIPTATPLPTPTPHPPRVYVSGAVTNPDVYELPAGSIVKDAIVAAGGATSKKGLECINLALPVADSQHVYVPKWCKETPTVNPMIMPSVTVASSPPEPATILPTSSEAGDKININTASQSEIETLPGIGPSKAQGIIEHRPYDSIEEIQKVPGIGEGIFKKIRDLITVD
jgi:competence protein ComEA